MKTPTTLTISSRYNGPPTSGNGGYSAGLLARLIDGPAAVSLRSPPPLDRPLEVRDTGSRLEVWAKNTLVMHAHAALPASPPPPAAPDLDRVLEGRPSIRAEEHPLPTCFVCGPSRATQDGLHIFSNHVRGYEGVANLWVPSREFGDETGQLRSELIWAALDCPSYFAIPGQPGLALLGSMCTRILQRPIVETPLIVAAWHERSDGRKHHTGSALYTADGDLLAQAVTLWIQLRPETKLGAPGRSPARCAG